MKEAVLVAFYWCSRASSWTAFLWFTSCPWCTCWSTRVDFPVLKLVTKVLLSPMLPMLSEYPQIAGLSIMIALWGMRLSKTALASIVAGHAVAFFAHHGVAKP